MHESQAHESRQPAPEATFRHSVQTEQQLGLTLSDRERKAILSACEVSGLDMDSYYSWYQSKASISSQLADLCRPSLLEAVHSIDRSDYSSIDGKLPADRGVVIALPHHGHYILSAVRLMEHIRHRRDIYIFYGDPKNHSGNELFDDLYHRLFNHAGCRASIIHSNARGIGIALRALKNRAAVIMMPDVHRFREETYCIPFLGRPLDIMLGTAAMARKTGSCILPAISVVDRDLRATITFGDAIEPIQTRASLPSEVADYWTMAEVYRFLERAMGPQAIYWQYIRQHFMKSSKFPMFHPETIDEAWHMFSNDPRTKPHTRYTACLD